MQHIGRMDSISDHWPPAAGQVSDGHSRGPGPSGGRPSPGGSQPGGRPRQAGQESGDSIRGSAETHWPGQWQLKLNKKKVFPGPTSQDAKSRV
jgi:hypothetical protein